MIPHREKVITHYAGDGLTFYLKLWNREHIHFAYFDEPPLSDEEPDQGFVPLVAIKHGVDRMMEVITEPAQIKPGDYVVDAGCGVGGTSRWMARQYDSNVTGLDLTPNQIEIAKSMTLKEGLSDRVQFHVADCAGRWPVEAQSVDAVVSVESALYYQSRHRFIEECARALKPGKRLVLQDWMRRDEMTLEEYIRDIQPICNLWAAWSLESLESYTKMFEETGFEVEEIEDFGDHALPNAQILAYAAKLHESAGRKEWSEGCDSLAQAWLSGSFVLGRICAVRAA